MATSKPIAASSPAVTATPDGDVRESQTAHSLTIKKSQSVARSAVRATAAAAAKPTAPSKVIEPDARLAGLLAWRATADAPAVVLDVVDTAIRRGTSTPRTIVPKADPAVVKTFFASLGMTRKQIAGLLGVSTSVVGVVQNSSPTADRWSQERFDRARSTLEAAAKKIAAKAK